MKSVWVKRSSCSWAAATHVGMAVADVQAADAAREVDERVAVDVGQRRAARRGGDDREGDRERPGDGGAIRSPISRERGPGISVFKLDRPRRSHGGSLANAPGLSRAGRPNRDLSRPCPTRFEPLSSPPGAHPTQGGEANPPPSRSIVRAQACRVCANSVTVHPQPAGADTTKKMRPPGWAASSRLLTLDFVGALPTDRSSRSTSHSNPAARSCDISWRDIPHAG